jgi:hypothetical protein
MSQLAAYRALQREMAALEDRLGALKDNDQLQADIQFEESLTALIQEHGYTKLDALRILDPSPVGQGGLVKTRKPRQDKTYRNPHTGETVVTKGANHKQIKAWREKYGDEVLNWAD